MKSAALFGGIDPSGSVERPCACVVLDDRLRVQDIACLCQDVEILRFFSPYKKGLHSIGLDGPCRLPVGLFECCFQEPSAGCPHQQPDDRKGRVCERELAKRGIGCFFTVKKAFAKGWVSRSLVLFGLLTEAGYDVLEVYPYATKRILFGRALPKKNTREGRWALFHNLRQLGIDMTDGRDYTHDELDAVVAAYTVYLHYRGETELVGEKTEGQIVLPKAS